MADGIHIPAFVVRLMALAAIVGLGLMVKGQMPEARRYLKMERM